VNADKDKVFLCGPNKPTDGDMVVVKEFKEWLRRCNSKDDCDYDDDLADALTPDEMWNEGGIKD
jgi:hypothetical protein